MKKTVITGLLIIALMLVFAINTFATTVNSNTATLGGSTASKPSTTTTTPSLTTTPSTTSLTNTTPSTTNSTSLLNSSTTSNTSSTSTLKPVDDTKESTKEKTLPKAGSSTAVFYALAVLSVVATAMYVKLKKEGK